jgi:hypothetical protein
MLDLSQRSQHKKLMISCLMMNKEPLFWGGSE